MKKFLIMVSIIFSIFCINLAHASCSPNDPNCPTGRDNTYVGGCKNKKLNDSCTDNKSAIYAECVKKNSTEELTCAAKTCKNGLHLWFYDENGTGENPMGICYSDNDAKNYCKNWCKNKTDKYECTPKYEQRTTYNRATDANPKTNTIPNAFVGCEKKLKQPEQQPQSFKIEYDMTNCGYAVNTTTPNCTSGNAPKSYAQGTGATIDCVLSYNKPYAFKSWCIDPKLTNCKERQIINTNDTGNKKFYAKCEQSPESRSITYNQGNCDRISTLNANCPNSYTTGTAQTIRCTPTITKENYKFVGWCDDSKLNTNCNQTKTIQTTDNTDKIFYAKCDKTNEPQPIPQKCTLVFNNSPSINNVSTGESAKAAAAKQYSEMGGVIDKNGSGPTISNYIGTEKNSVITQNVDSNSPHYDPNTPHLFDLTEVLVNGKRINDLDEVIRQLHDSKTTYAEFKCNNGNPSINLSEQKNPIGRAECTITGYCDSDNNYGDYTGGYSTTTTTLNIDNITTKLDKILDEHFTKSSVWKNDEGKFNTARLASDSIAGVVLGTVGGIVTSKIIKKNQIKNGFQDLKCTIGGQAVATYGDEFTVGLQ